jgi:hypothetical protein
MAREAVVAFLESINEGFPIVLCSSYTAIPRVVILVFVLCEERKLITDDLACSCLGRWIKVISELSLKTYRRFLSSIEIEEDESLGRDVGMYLE